ELQEEHAAGIATHIEALSEAQRVADSTVKDILKILDDAKKASAEIGIAQQAIHFKKVADTCKYTSWGWGAATVIWGRFRPLVCASLFAFAIGHNTSEHSKHPGCSDHL